MKILYVTFFLLSSISTYAKTSRLYFLAIGNEHYRVGTRPNQQGYTNVPGVISSTEKVKSVFDQYGVGRTLKSGNNGQFLTKQSMLDAIQQTFTNAKEDSSSIIVIYYCGHGGADFLGNLYFIPGNYKVPQGHVDQRVLAEEYLSVYEIEQLFNNYCSDIISERLSSLSQENMVKGFKENLEFTKFIQDYCSYFQALALSEITDHDRSNLTLPNRLPYDKKISSLPKLIILADCCYDKFSFDKSFSPDYIDMMKSYLYKKMNGSAGEGRKSVPEFYHYSENNCTRGIFSLLGGKAVYSTKIFEATELTQFSENIWLGHIAQRINNYFQKKENFFSTYNLLKNLVTKSSKDDSNISYLEVPNNKGTFDVIQSLFLDEYDKHHLDCKIYLR